MFQTSITRACGRSIDAQIAEDALDVLRLRCRIRVGDVAQMKDKVGLDHLFQRGPEGGDQMRRQVGDEAHRIRRG